MPSNHILARFRPVGGRRLMRSLVAGLLVSLFLPPLGFGQAREDAAAGSGGTNLPEHHGKPHVILISFDGMRWDYLDRTDTPNFDRVQRRGVRAESLIPVFPTLTFPMHYSIATGMYSESHGLIGNTIYDPVWDAHYRMGDRTAVEDGRWYGGEPIWVTAERQGMVSASFFWVGSEAPVQGIRPTHYRIFDNRIPNEDRVDQVLAWLREPPRSRPHMITLYYADVDSRGHRFGPDSPETNEAVRAMDTILGRLLDGIEALPVRDRVHVVIISDHGMAWSDGSGRIFLDDLTDLEGIQTMGQGVSMAFRFDGDTARRAAVYADLRKGLKGRGARVFLREELPERYRYRESHRAPDMLVLADAGYLVGRRGSLADRGRGMHGYDPAEPSMHGVFLAMGPRIQGALRIPAFEAVHIYPLLAKILELEPNPDIDGRLEVLEPILLPRAAVATP